jgi:PAS domain S-box-containing protein
MLTKTSLLEPVQSLPFLLQERAAPPGGGPEAAGSARAGAVDKLLFRCNPQPMWIYDLETLRVLTANEAAALHYGRSCAEFLGLAITDLYAPEEVERLRGARAEGGAEPGGLWTHCRRDGKRMAVNVTAQPCEYAGRRAAFVIARDISAELESERSLWASEDRFRLLVQHSPDLILVIGREGTILYATPASEAVLGLPPESLIGKNAFALVHPRDRARSRTTLSRLIAVADDSALMEMRLRHADGHWVVLETHCRNLLHSASVRGVVVNTRDVSRRKVAEEEVKRQLQQLNALRLVDAAITAGREIGETLGIVLDQVLACLAVDAAACHLFAHPGEDQPLVVDRGFRTRSREGAGPLAPLSGGSRGEQGVRAVQPLAAACAAGERWLAEQEGFVAYWAIPILLKGDRNGLLELYRRSPLDPEPGWFQFLEALAEQAAIAIEGSHLAAALERSHQELETSYERTLEGWVRAVDLRDRETKGHAERVTRLTVQLAARMGFAGEELANVRRGALLHDIGKIAIPDEVLLKPDRLTEDEWDVMRLHPFYAYEFLFPIPHLRAAIDIPYYHHEKWDGSGYPLGLQGTAIPLAARIFAVVDVWDALLSDRPYRPAWSKEQVLEHVRQGAGSHFDPAIVPVFLAMITEMDAF